MKFIKSRAPVAFKPLRGGTLKGKNIQLRDKKLSDARNDYAWQSDPELSRFDAVAVLNMPFTIYLLDYTAELKRPRRNRYPLAIETLDGKHIGNCTCYEIDEKKGEMELGIVIGDAAYRDKGYGQDVINTVVDHVFRNTSLYRIYLKTLDWNKRAQNCFKKCGFKPYGEMTRNGHNFVLMELDRGRWEKGGSRLKDNESPTTLY
jgi:RimJ/RimL family protein N-acetyltransferase